MSETPEDHLTASGEWREERGGELNVHFCLVQPGPLAAASILQAGGTAALAGRIAPAATEQTATFSAREAKKRGTHAIFPGPGETDRPEISDTRAYNNYACNMYVHSVLYVYTCIIHVRIFIRVHLVT